MTDETKSPPKATDWLAEFSLGRILERAAARPPIYGPPLPRPIRYIEEGTERPLLCGTWLVRPRKAEPGA